MVHDFKSKELSFWHKLLFLIFISLQPNIVDLRLNNLSLKYQRLQNKQGLEKLRQRLNSFD